MSSTTTLSIKGKKDFLIWSNEIKLTEFLASHSTKSDKDSCYEISKSAVKDILIYLINSLVYITEKTNETVNDMADIELYGDDEKKIFRDFYVNGRILMDAKKKVWNDYTCNCFNLFVDSFGTSVEEFFKLMEGLVKFLAEMNEDDVLILTHD